MRYLAMIFLVATVAACGEWRAAGTLANPVCAPDGSAVWIQFADSKGSYEGAKASAANCPWAKK